MKRGIFITFEGGEGAGKSTQVELLAEGLRERGFKVVTTREPGGTKIGEQIRAITHDQENVDLHPIAEAYLMAASRAQHVAQIIKLALDDGKIVVCDRYIDSSIVYQGYGRRLGERTIRDLNELAIDGIWPDMTFFLDVDPKLGAARRGKTAKIDRLDLQQKKFYKDVYTGYKSLIAAEKKRFVVINANQSIEETASDIWEKTQNLLKSHHVNP